MVYSLVKVSALAVVVLTGSTKAHNQMNVPLATWPEGFYNKNSPSGTVDSANVLPLPKGMTYTADSDSNTKAYWTAFNDSKYKTLKELAFDTQTLESGATNECGYALADGEAQELPDAVEWDRFDHQGPCEVWCDETIAYSNWNCAVTHKESPAKLPYDKAKCEGKGVLLSLYLGLHTAPWQVYAVCVPIAGGSGGAKSSTPAATPGTSSGSGTPPATPSESATPAAASGEDQADSKGTNSGDSGDSGTPATPSAPETPPATPSAPETPPATPSAPETPPATPSEPATPSVAPEAEQTDSQDTDAGASDTPATPPSSNDKCSVRRRR